MEHIKQIDHKQNSILYRKTSSGKYIQVTDPWAYDGLRKGWWMVGVQDNCTSIRQCIFPDKAPIIAAAMALEDELTTIIYKAGEARPANIKLTTECAKDWDKFIAKHGHQFNTLINHSSADISKSIIKQILKHEY